jgi:hypothetical protein
MLGRFTDDGKAPSFVMPTWRDIMAAGNPSRWDKPVAEATWSPESLLMAV